MKYTLIHLLFFLILPSIASADIILTEIMYNPNQCSDYDCEWVEIYNNGNETISLENWSINGDSFEGANITAYSYLIIARELIDTADSDNESFEAYWGNSDKIWNSTDADYTAIEGPISLGNSEGIINITNSTYTLFINYSSNWGADGNGKTLEKIYLNEDDSALNWAESYYINGTPGRVNSRYINESEEINYNKLSISEFLPDPEGDDIAPMPSGEWVEIYNSGSAALSLEGLILYDSSNNEMYITKTNTIDGTIIPPNGYMVVYRNSEGDFSLNNDGYEELKFYDRNENLLDSISYSDSSEGSSFAKANGIWQKTKPTPGSENVNYSDSSQSYLEIEKIYDMGSDNISKFGQAIRVKAIVYKGDTTKDSIALWVEDDKEHRLSKESKTNVYTRYTNYALTLPIQIIPNCDYNYEDGDYKIVMEGLDKRETAEIGIEGLDEELCSQEELEEITGERFEYELVSAPDEIEAEKEFAVNVRLVNNEYDIHNINIWSYVYRGSKCYSCLEKREENKKAMALPRKESAEVELKNTIYSAQPGDYKLKVLIKKDDLKTAKEITQDIKVISSSKPNISIEKFYTEEKKPKSDIILTAVIKNNENENIDFGLVLESFSNFLLQNISIKPEKEKTIELPVNIYPGNNVFFLKLEKDSNILGMKELLIRIEGDKLEQYSDTISLFSQFNQTISQNLPLQSNINRITGDVLLSQKEPRTVYESKNIEIKKLIPVFIITFLAIFNIVLVKRR